MNIDKPYSNFFQSLLFRRAAEEDLSAIIKLLSEDELGKTRESLEEVARSCYEIAFQKIKNDPAHALMVVELEGEVIGTCHLTVIPSLTFHGSTRLQVESVRIAASLRGNGIGAWMFERIFEYAKAQEALLVQLTTNKKRTHAKKFYESLGFEASHEGMKFAIPVL